VKHKRFIGEKFSLGHDVLRHTFISMLVAATHSKDFTAMQAGNSVGIINKHYYAIKMPSEAKEFFRIAPKQRGEVAEVMSALMAMKTLKSGVTMKPIPMVKSVPKVVVAKMVKAAPALKTKGTDHHVPEQNELEHDMPEHHTPVSAEPVEVKPMDVKALEALAGVA
jgi:hypothetical protein